MQLSKKQKQMSNKDREINYKILPFLATSISSSVQREVSPVSQAKSQKEETQPNQHRQKRRGKKTKSDGGRERGDLFFSHLLMANNLIICLHSALLRPAPSHTLSLASSFFSSLSSNLSVFPVLHSPGTSLPPRPPAPL